VEEEQKGLLISFKETLERGINSKECKKTQHRLKWVAERGIFFRVRNVSREN